MVGRVHTALSGQQPSGSCAHPITESAGTLAKIPCNLREFFFSFAQKWAELWTSVAMVLKIQGLGIYIEQGWKERTLVLPGGQIPALACPLHCYLGGSRLLCAT